jgi:hypothetical protein
MRVLKGLLFIAGGLLALALMAGFFLPTSAHVERTARIDADPESLYGIVSGFRRFNEWSPWSDLDPDTRYTYSGPESGVGARMEWRSEKPDVGSGSQEITAADPGRSVTMRLEFGDSAPATSTISMKPEGPVSVVTWTFDTSFEDNFLGRYFGVFFDRFIGADYEKGLARLKALAEAEAGSIPPG